MCCSSSLKWWVQGPREAEDMGTDMDVDKGLEAYNWPQDAAVHTSVAGTARSPWAMARCWFITAAAAADKNFRLHFNY